MPPLPVLKAKEVVRVLVRAGFYIHHQSGSHARMLHHNRSDLRVTIPMHNKELPAKTLKSVIKQAGMTVDEFCKLLE